MDSRNLSTFYINNNSIPDLPSLTTGDQLSYSLPSTATSQREADASSPISVGESSLRDSGIFATSAYTVGEKEEPYSYMPNKMATPPVSHVPARALAESGPGVDSLTGTATSLRLFVSKLPNSVTPRRLRDYITNHLIMQGVPHSAATNCLLDVYQPNGENGRLRNFAFVSFSDRSYLDLLLATGPGPGGVHVLDGRAVLMDVAAPRGLKVKQDTDEHGRLLGTVSLADAHATGAPAHSGMPPSHGQQHGLMMPPAYRPAPGPYGYGQYGPGRDIYEQPYGYGPNAPYARPGPWYGPGDMHMQQPYPMQAPHGQAGPYYPAPHGQGQAWPQQQGRGYEYGAANARGFNSNMGGGFTVANTTPAGLPPSLQR